MVVQKFYICDNHKLQAVRRISGNVLAFLGRTLLQPEELNWIQNQKNLSKPSSETDKIKRCFTADWKWIKIWNWMFDWLYPPRRSREVYAINGKFFAILVQVRLWLIVIGGENSSLKELISFSLSQLIFLQSNVCYHRETALFTSFRSVNGKLGTLEQPLHFLLSWK